MAGPAADQTCMAFDVGRLKTGVAVGNARTRGAQPLTIIRTSDPQTRLVQVARLVEEWRPDGFVVGLPSHPDGKPLPNTATCRAFAKSLRERFGRPVAFVDERLSTHEAAALMRERDQASGRRAGGQRRPDDDDAEAAAVILRQYWSEQALAPDPDPPPTATP